MAQIIGETDLYIGIVGGFCQLADFLQRYAVYPSVALPNAVLSNAIPNHAVFDATGM